METSKESIYITGIVVTWITGLIGAGIGIGKSRERAEETNRRISKLEVKQQKDVDEIKELIQTEFAKFQAYFHTQDGDDRFLTERRHNELCGNQKEHRQRMESNQEDIFKKLSSLAVSMGKIEQELSKE